MSKLVTLCVSQKVLPYNIKIHRTVYNQMLQSVKLTERVNASKTTSICRCYCSEKKESSSLTKVKSTAEVGTALKQVKETTKTASYLGVILVGVGVTGVLFYQIFRELFSSKSPNSVYSSSLKKCCNDTRITDALGKPIKGFGEETRRGRRRHVSHIFYERDGVKYLRMKYYIQGSIKRGTVHLEMKENEKGDFVYRYLFVQLDDYPRTVYTLEDNRQDQQTLNFDKLFDTI